MVLMSGTKTHVLDYAQGFRITRWQNGKNDEMQFDAAHEAKH